MAEAIQTETRNELIITRIFDAPRDFVWDAFTNCEQVMHWWGPKDFTAPFCKIDLRVGGKYLLSMRAPDGKEYWSTGVYREIIPQERYVATDSFSDPEGNIVPATYYGMSADFPLEMLVTVTFEDYEGQTKLTLKHAGFPSAEDLDGAQTGWNESFDKLDEFLLSENG